jgi:hypothetical protein
VSYAFISYKREDEVRVGRLARALEKGGVEVWWDPELHRSENWRDELEAKLDGAACVIVVWSAGSVGREGAFVRDEAGRAMKRGILVPVVIDRKVSLPLGFGEVQAIDLSHWRGGARDPFFRDLVAVVAAKLAGKPPPPPVGPRARIARRLFYGATTSGVVGCAALLAFNTFGVASNICNIPGPQPGLSDACGACRLGDRPTRAERMAWAALPRGSCSALRDHIARFPDGAYRREAADLLTARRVSYRQVCTPAERQLALYVPPVADTAAARSRALATAEPEAQRLCQGFGSGTLFRYVSAKAVAQSWSCSGGSCTAAAAALCTVKQCSQVEQESCGSIS